MSRPRAGDIVIVDWRVDARPKEPTRTRPALVVEDSDLFPEDYPNLLVAPMTSDEGLAQYADQRLAFAQASERGIECAWQGERQIMRRTGNRLGGLQVFDHAQIAAGQRSRDGEIRIGIGAADTVFHAAVLRPGIRHAHGRIGGRDEVLRLARRVVGQQERQRAAVVLVRPEPAFFRGHDAGKHDRPPRQ